jgi:hypothetical protein
MPRNGKTRCGFAGLPRFEADMLAPSHGENRGTRLILFPILVAMPGAVNQNEGGHGPPAIARS